MLCSVPGEWLGSARLAARLFRSTHFGTRDRPALHSYATAQYSYDRVEWNARAARVIMQRADDIRSTRTRFLLRGAQWKEWTASSVTSRPSRPSRRSRRCTHLCHGGCAIVNTIVLCRRAAPRRPPGCLHLQTPSRVHTHMRVTSSGALSPTQPPPPLAIHSERAAA